MNLRTIFISSFLSLSSLGVLAQERINLSGTWQFAFAANQKEADRLERFYTSDFAKSKFKLTPVPSNWALLGYEEPVYRGFKDNQAGEGFYVREFTIPQDWKDKRILLHFGGVWSSAEVWLNGNELGRHDCGYTSFAFDVTNKLKVDEPNKLAVRVRQITREYKFDVCDDWTWGGIYRDVTLEAMPAERWIDDVVVQTTFDHLFQDANLDIRVMISDKHKNTLPGNYPSPGEPYKLCFTLTDKEGKEVAQRQMAIPAHVSTDREICLSLPVEAPHQWTAETPYLYSLKVELLEKEAVTHTRMERVGFRQISTDEESSELTDKQLNFVG